MKMANMTCVRCKARITGRVFGEFTIEPNGDLTFDEAKGEGPTCEPCVDGPPPKRDIERGVKCADLTTEQQAAVDREAARLSSSIDDEMRRHLASPRPWQVGLGYEQLDPGVYITDAKGLVIYADSEKSATGENLSEANARLIVDAVNAHADLGLRFYNPRTLRAMTLGDTMKPGGTLPLGGAAIEQP